MDFNKIKTPAYVVFLPKIKQNLEILRRVKEETGCKILLAQKAFSMFSIYPLIADYLDGTTASGINEARLGREEMNKENHIFAPAYGDVDFSEIVKICDHIVFNSIAQLNKFLDKARAYKREIGIRVNPEKSTQEHSIYDPCAPLSRLGIKRREITMEIIEKIDGLHFHTLCEQNADALEETLKAFEEKFGTFIPQLKWVNFGGGHHITREDYDLSLLIRLIKEFKAKYNVQVYLEPGEAIALNAGYLVSDVMDIVENDKNIAILSASAACHMPDVLEMPYTPKVLGNMHEGQKQYKYVLAGNTCLAGDVIGEYSFDRPLKVNDKIIFLDMAIYTMVKNNTFNGINLPSIYTVDDQGLFTLIKEFFYEDFKSRLS
ncbi:MAG: carboxynorspermidine decarboxylase [Clostridia bacterium]|nr:carboxynorspermidine decarboxylase [Clostridia bacterium]